MEQQNTNTHQKQSECPQIDRIIDREDFSALLHYQQRKLMQEKDLESIVNDARVRFALVERVLDITTGGDEIFDNPIRTGIWRAFRETIVDLERYAKEKGVEVL